MIYKVMFGFDMGAMDSELDDEEQLESEPESLVASSSAILASVSAIRFNRKAR